MTDYPRSTPTQARLYLLTLRMQGELSNAYSMATSVEDAYSRYLDRLARRKESAVGVEFVRGELANPHAESRA